MKQPSLTDLRFISPMALRSWFASKSPSGNGKFAVVDVRDSDFVGGHIKGCYHYAAGEIYETLPELRRRLLENKIDDVVFHCALSQVRGPKSTLVFLRSLQDLPSKEREDFKDMNVWVLSGGFTAWQRLYGKDKEVTEGYQEDIWA
ncbi:Rhodanese-like protein [Metschnikowia bicuspidata var. bicuspidata NRRL YB-4993]|uniref:Rhodanese-like protein n=1 Tax=Metschnikowia bicuspidata var. bicuspidata NRRL YB-4993 TaxID=869754 RepID=A0A1A0H5K0_9ASCO|nr:Rhodanese-like protein [Metschnikowia bicuspidata var. bicuspidata NRRL YB-4993]OBA19369.1 Rhodanese-like protein [Metschnikowia bicuspidata var. bicuspidata NRRL YB-4993]